MVDMKVEATRRGRPRKYNRPARAVTLTLPEDVLTRLSAVHTDVGRAIVSLVDTKLPRTNRPIAPTEIENYGNQAVIVVSPLKALKRLEGVHLVPIGNGRALISLERTRSIPELELELRDLIASDTLSQFERDALECIADILRRSRAASNVTVEERTIIVLGSKRRRGSPLS